MGNIVKPTIILSMIVFCASFALSHINKITYPNIRKQEILRQEQALTSALPGYTIREQKTAAIDGSDFIYWIADRKDGLRTSRGYAFIAVKTGYSGPVKTIVGVDESGMILGISIIQQSETPGLGARCVEVASTETFFQHFFGKSTTVAKRLRPWFQEQFSGLKTGKKIEIVKKGDWNSSMQKELIDKNAISAITGATITTRTVRDSIEAGLKKLYKALGQSKTAAGA